MLLGMTFALLAALSWGSSDVFARRAMAHMPISVLMVMSMVIILLGTGSLALLTSGVSAFTGLSPVFFGWVALMAVFGYITGVMLQFLGLRTAGVGLVAPIIGGATPLFALLLAVTLGSERPSLATVAGALIIVTGIVLIVSDRKRVIL